MPTIFGVIASILTIYHSLLHPDPLAVFYILIISLLFTLVTIFVIFSTSNNINNIKSIPKITIFLCYFISIIIWLGINKTIPEHKEIIDFQKKRGDLIYWINKEGLDGMKHLAYLYMDASPAIKRIEPHANHLGTKLMRVYLKKQIDAGRGTQFSNDMYNLPEAAFIYSSRYIAHTWYKFAYQYGRTDALQRYEERMIHYR